MTSYLNRAVAAQDVYEKVSLVPLNKLCTEPNDAQRELTLIDVSLFG